MKGTIPLGIEWIFFYNVIFSYKKALPALIRMGKPEGSWLIGDRKTEPFASDEAVQLALL